MFSKTAPQKRSTFNYHMKLFFSSFLEEKSLDFVFASS